MQHEFLSDSWFQAVKELPVPAAPPEAADLTINVVVTAEGSDDVAMHLAAGQLERGLDEAATATLTLPIDVAKAMFVAQDQAVAMQAFMSGRIKVSGDMTKIMALGQRTPTPEQAAYSQQIQALTIV